MAMQSESPDRQEDVEIYVRACSVSDILRWLSGVLGPFRQLEATPILYISENSEPPFTLLMWDEIGDGTYTSVMLAPNSTPWATDVAFARAAYAALDRAVRCDPGALSAKPWHWLEISPSGEALVEWDEEAE